MFRLVPPLRLWKTASLFIFPKAAIAQLEKISIVWPAKSQVVMCTTDKSIELFETILVNLLWKPYLHLAEQWPGRKGARMSIDLTAGRCWHGRQFKCESIFICTSLRLRLPWFPLTTCLHLHIAVYALLLARWLAFPWRPKRVSASTEPVTSGSSHGDYRSIKYLMVRALREGTVSLGFVSFGWLPPWFTHRANYCRLLRLVNCTAAPWGALSQL